MSNPIHTKTPRKRYIEKETKLFKYLMDTYKLRTDDDLANFLFCSKTVISMTRRDHRQLTPRLILRIYDKASLSVEDIRAWSKEYIYGDV